ncbi:MAG TPA: carboxypeptidase-like regulatory domain-containing protein [Terriglobales bacterium]|nr:carboxypeptidase-like regulatory domain-containing protein [Dongiaceae bacterium]HVO64720.1 carboxypeptidase-like regulatory domain-containing protein [Terriglobales bacterium]
MVSEVHNDKGESLDMHRHAIGLSKALRLFLLAGGLASVLTAPMLAQNVPSAQEQATAQYVSYPQEQAATIAATVTDPNGGTIPSATVVLQGPESSDRYTITTNERGFFEFRDLTPATPYQLTIRAAGFADWSSSAIVLEPSQYKILSDCRLRLAEVQTSVNVHYSSEEVAAEQVAAQEKQRVFGVIPNFYVSYDHNPAPLTPKLKFQLAMKLSTDPVTALGVGLVAGIRQAADSPNFQQGAKGYGQRFGVTAANSFTGILIGGAILPSLLHQDPRYFYQGTGTTKSRLFHALSYPFICPGDNGHLQPNYSSLGGDLIAAGISNAYYPQSNRGASLVLSNFAIGIAEHALTGLAQEFLLRRFTSRAEK